MLERSTSLVLLLGFLTTLGFMVYAGEPSNPWWWLLFVPFAAWAGGPYVAVALVARRPSSSRASRLIALLTAIGLTAFGAYSLFTAFVTHLDAQSGIVFVFLPLYQLIGVFPMVLIAQSLTPRERVNR